MIWFFLQIKRLATLQSKNTLKKTNNASSHTQFATVTVPHTQTVSPELFLATNKPMLRPTVAPKHLHREVQCVMEWIHNYLLKEVLKIATNARMMTAENARNA